MKQDFDHQLLARHAFGLADPAMLAELPEGIATVPIVPQGLEASAHLMPGLVDFRALPGSAASVMLECLHDTHVAGIAPPIQVLIGTDATAQEFMQSWNTMQLPASGGQRSWLRLHDPRVLHHVWRILAPAQRRVLLGRSLVVTYWLGGEWCSIAREDVGHAGPAVPRFSGTAAWNWARIGNIGILNRALNAAGIHAPALVNRHAAAAEELIDRARVRHGLATQADLVEFTMRGLTMGAAFDDHPAVAAAIRGTSEDSDLADRLALIDDSVWQQLRQGAIAS